MDTEIARQIDEQRALDEEKLFEQWLTYPLWEPEDAAILLELRYSPDEAWSYGREDTEVAIFDLLLHFYRCGLIDTLDGSTFDGLVVHGKALLPAIWIAAYLDFPGKRPLPFDPPPIPPTPDTRQTITGPTFAKLQAAIEAYPAAYAGKTPKLDDDVRPWLKEKHGCTSREADVFGAIIAEHFGLK